MEKTKKERSEAIHDIPESSYIDITRYNTWKNLRDDDVVTIQIQIDLENRGSYVEQLPIVTDRDTKTYNNSYFRTFQCKWSEFLKDYYGDCKVFYHSIFSEETKKMAGGCLHPASSRVVVTLTSGGYLIGRCSHASSAHAGEAPVEGVTSYFNVYDGYGDESRFPSVYSYDRIFRLGYHYCNKSCGNAHNATHCIRGFYVNFCRPENLYSLDT